MASVLTQVFVDGAQDKMQVVSGNARRAVLHTPDPPPPPPTCFPGTVYRVHMYGVGKDTCCLSTSSQKRDLSNTRYGYGMPSWEQPTLTSPSSGYPHASKNHDHRRTYHVRIGRYMGL